MNVVGGAQVPVPAAQHSSNISVFQVVIAAVYIAAAFAVLFTAQLHRDVAFDRLLLGGSLLVFVGARSAQLLFWRESAVNMVNLLQLIVDAVVALCAFMTVDALQFGSTVLVWFVATTGVRVVALWRYKHAALAEMLVSVILPLLVTIAVFFVRADAVAAIGLFGAYTVVVGIFGMIAAFDGSATVKR